LLMVAFGAELAIVLLFSLIGGLVATRFRQPAVLGLLIAGAIIGPNALGLVSQSDLINTFAELGAAFLLFTIGVEFSVSKLLRIGLRAIIVAALKLAFVFIITYEVALLTGMSLFSAFILGAILSITSTALVAKMLYENHLKGRKEAYLLMAVLIIEDVYAVFLLTLFSAIKVGGGTPQYHELLIPLVSALLILAVVFILMQKVLRRLFSWVLKHKNEESFVLVALVLAVGFGYAASTMGLEPSIGAFVGGSMAAALPGGRVIERSIKPFTAAFSSIFFLSMGMLVIPETLITLLPFILLFALLNIAAKFVGIGMSTYITGLNGKQAVFAGLTMLSVGEFSLLLAREGATLVSFDLIGFTAGVVVITALAASLASGKEERVYGFLSRSLPTGISLSLLHFSTYFTSVIRRFEPGGRFFKTFVRESMNALLNIFIMVLVLGAAALFIPYVQGWGIEYMGYAIGIITLLLCVKPFLNVLESAKEMMDSFTDAFLRMRRRRGHARLNERLMKDSMLFLFFLLFSMNMPLLLGLVRLERLWPLSYIPVGISILLFWDMSRVLRRMFGGMRRLKQADRIRKR